MRYIGKSLVIGSRIYQHQGEINRTMAKYAELVNIGADWSKSGTYIRLAKYLLENPKITTGTVEVLERQVCSNALYYAENRYLKEIHGNEDFCNWSHFGSKPKREEDNLWDVAEANGQLEFFDPRIGGERIRTNRTQSQNNDLLKQINAIKQSASWRKRRLGEWAKRVLGDNPTLEMRKAVVEYQMREIARITSS